jgi:acetoacetyl-CoA synthetase
VTEPLYTPTRERIAGANVTRFTAFCAERLGRTFSSYDDLYQWSVDDIPAFWAAVWDFLEVTYSAPYDTVVDDLTKFPGASWFPGARLNFAQNLLRYDDDRVAILFKGETRPATRLTYRELNRTVARLARD